MPYLRNPKFWIPLYLFIIGFCVWKYKKQGLIIIVLMALSAGLCRFYKCKYHQNLWLKEPAHVVILLFLLPILAGLAAEPVIVFPSTHATDHFAMAIFIILLFYKKWKWIWLWGILWGRDYLLCTGLCRRTLPDRRFLRCYLRSLSRLGICHTILRR